MTLADVLQWLKSLGVPSGVEGWTIARLDAAKERRVGVWQDPSSGPREVALGGPSATVTRTKRVRVLVHWNRNARDTETAAQALYDAIAAADHPAVGDATATYVEMACPEPVDVGADEQGCFERAIPFVIHYQ